MGLKSCVSSPLYTKAFKKPKSTEKRKKVCPSLHRAGAIAPPTVNYCQSETFFVRKFSSKNTKFRAGSVPFWGI